MINDNKDNEDNAIGGLYGLKAQKESCPFGAYVSNDVYVVRRVKSVKSDKSVFDTSSFSEIKNIGLL